ncbi:MAG: CDP-alcohol phosphatidyltransferase family protein [Acidobacteriota bacterium]|nr:CDP-alcohol phosphatidyltransferase family protein [Acidobacteriota bacterium]
MSVSETTVRAGDESAAPIASAVILALRPEWAWEVGGLTVLDRLVRALERRGIAWIRVISPGEEIGLDAVRRRAAEKRGATLLFTAPVLVDAAALVRLEALPVLRGEPVCLAGGFAGPGDTVGYLVAAGDAGALPEFLAGEGAALAVGNAGPRCRTMTVDTGLFQALKGRRGVAAARSALRRTLSKPTDGFFAAWIDRRLSTRLSLLLARAGVTPNQVTLLALFPALLGAALLAVPNPAWSAAGALLFWVSTVLDGCDGEVARLTYQESEEGARLDLLCDNVALVAVFLGILVHLYLEEGGRTVPILGAAILIGMVGCMATEYVRILRPRIEAASGRGAAAAGPSSARVLWYERLASRDFAYLLPFLAWFGGLRYLVWATAVGVNVFWVVLATFVASGRREVSR